MWHTRCFAKVLVCRTGRTFALDQQCTLASWRTRCQLIESQNFAAMGQNAGTGLLGDTQCAHLQLWYVQQACVVGNGANNNGNGFGRSTVFHETRHSLQRNGRTIDPAHKQTFQHNFVKLFVRTSVQETVELKVNGKSNISIITS